MKDLKHKLKQMCKKLVCTQLQLLGTIEEKQKMRISLTNIMESTIINKRSCSLHCQKKNRSVAKQIWNEYSIVHNIF